MQQFLIVAAAHFLALLSPGPDFFLIARSALAASWRIASGTCLGIALANGVFIVAAFAGFAVLQAGSPLFLGLQFVGALYLLYLGQLFLRHAGKQVLPPTADAAPAAGKGKLSSWRQALGSGFLCGILNPKNALFYASLAAMLAGGPHNSPAWKAAYGSWMFSIVLLWDLLVAGAIGNRAVLRHFAESLPWLERTTGAVLILLALGVIGMLVFS
ncbi:LysE family transporter [Azoarcus indigens]|uniref:Threonine/homoserine/homoserine lactone efflux protein n=1 Tax=Azoarcus indigens TaxID=29545 RepID=A0A4R6DM67_9RHOO|nr:LysE family translocator [Azoarcus indigens]NMG66089.1 LysE family transporter [Azoarcus indigens]TDN46016.1 threonine/homoserine/homoserine lactone efflux protein [Azoarcus indigens]